MGVCTLAGIPFTIDPESVSWSYTARVSETKTVGGKVVQVYGATLDDMTVVGWFGSGGYRAQQRFLDRMKRMAGAQEIQAGQSGGNPVKFQYPGRGWDFLVYLKAYTSNAGSRSVVLRNEILHNLRWSLTLHIAEENIGLKAAAQDMFIKRLSEGLGWSTRFHGPLEEADIQRVLAGRDYVTFAQQTIAASQTATTEGGGQ